MWFAVQITISLVFLTSKWYTENSLFLLWTIGVWRRKTISVAENIAHLFFPNQNMFAVHIEF